MVEVDRRYRIVIEEVDDKGAVAPGAQKGWAWLTITRTGWSAYQAGNRDAVSAALASSACDAIDAMEAARHADI